MSAVGQAIRGFHQPEPGPAAVFDEQAAESIRSLTELFRELLDSLRPPEVQRVEGEVRGVGLPEHDDTAVRDALAEFARVVALLAEERNVPESPVQAFISDTQLDRLAATILTAQQAPTVDLEPLLQAVKGIKFPQMSVGGGELREVKLRNSSDVVVNPATQETVSSIDTKLPALSGGRVPVTATGTVVVTNSDLETLAGAVDDTTDPANPTLRAKLTESVTLKDADSGVTAQVDATNGLAVDVKQSALPAGAATSALQTDGNTTLTAIDGYLNPVTWDAPAADITVAGTVQTLAADTAKPWVRLENTGSTALRYIIGAADPTATRGWRLLAGDTAVHHTTQEVRYIRETGVSTTLAIARGA